MTGGFDKSGSRHGSIMLESEQKEVLPGVHAYAFSCKNHSSNITSHVLQLGPPFPAEITNGSERQVYGAYLSTLRLSQSHTRGRPNQACLRYHHKVAAVSLSINILEILLHTPCSEHFNPASQNVFDCCTRVCIYSLGTSIAHSIKPQKRTT